MRDLEVQTARCATRGAEAAKREGLLKYYHPPLYHPRSPALSLMTWPGFALIPTSAQACSVSASVIALRKWRSSYPMASNWSAYCSSLVVLSIVRTASIPLPPPLGATTVAGASSSVGFVGICRGHGETSGPALTAADCMAGPVPGAPDSMACLGIAAGDIGSVALGVGVAASRASDLATARAAATATARAASAVGATWRGLELPRSTALGMCPSAFSRASEWRLMLLPLPVLLPLLASLISSFPVCRPSSPQSPSAATTAAARRSWRRRQCPPHPWCLDPRSHRRFRSHWSASPEPTLMKVRTG